MRVTHHFHWVSFSSGVLKNTGMRTILWALSISLHLNQPNELKHFKQPKKAIACDPDNALYYDELGYYFSLKMSETWKEGAGELRAGKRVFNPGEKALRYGRKALHSYGKAVALAPSNAWYHFSSGWMRNELTRFYPGNSPNAMPPTNSGSFISPHPHARSEQCLYPGRCVQTVQQ